MNQLKLKQTVWFTPDTGIEFLPCKTWRAHTGAVNAMETTWKHMVTAADDGVILLYELGTLLLQRKIDTYVTRRDIREEDCYLLASYV